MLKTLIYFSLIISLFACNKTPLVSNIGENTPYLSQSTFQIDSVLIEMSIEEKLGQLIIYETKPEQVTSQDSILNVFKALNIGGVNLIDFPLSDFIHLVDSIRSISTISPLIGTYEGLSLHNHFKDFRPFPSFETAACLDSIALLNTLNKQYIKQLSALSINTFLCQNKATYRLKEKINSNFPNQDLQHTYHTAWTLPDSIIVTDSVESRGRYFYKKYLAKEIDFHGLIYANVYSKSQILSALFAGADMFVTDNAQQTYHELKKAWELGILSEYELNTKVRSILIAKQWLHKGQLFSNHRLGHAQLVSNRMQKKRVKKPSNTKFHSDFLSYFNNDAWPFLAQLIYEKSIIITNNHQALLPYKKTYKKDFRIIQYSTEELKYFKQSFSKYAYYARYHYPPINDHALKPLKAEAHRWSTPIIILDNQQLQEKEHQEFIAQINTLSKQAKTVLINFGNPFNLKHFEETVTTIQIFERNKTTESLVAQLLFGGIQGEGKLPVAVSEFYDLNTQNSIQRTRMKYTIPEEVGIKKARLVGIDALANAAIQKKAAPGCQILVAKEGKIVYSKAFGHHTYKKHQYVNRSDLYDLASITKVAATTLSAMKLFDQGNFDIHAQLKTQLALPNSATIGHVTVKNLMIHQSGLQAQMPIGTFLSRKDTTHQLCNNYFCKTAQDSFDIQVSKSLFFKAHYIDTIWNSVYHLPIKRYSKYRYSDVNFNLVQKIVEEKSNIGLKDYTFQEFYQPLGLRKTLYNPLDYYQPVSIVPTEEDEKWRKELLRGYVHDETAALFGGVSGNAGLFSNAEDLAIIFQMLLNGGQYGGKQYLKKETIDYFTGNNFGSTRGLGFDKPRNRRAPAYAKDASADTYGHTGFTGTCVWVDPQHDLIFIFLSNRIHPNMWNKNLFKEETRSRIHQIVYDAMDTFEYELPDLEMNDKDRI